jgi:hypothetical protein
MLPGDSDGVYLATVRNPNSGEPLSPVTGNMRIKGHLLDLKKGSF